MTRELTPKAPVARPKRTSTGVRNRLSVTKKDPNFEYRIVTDREDRVEILREIGYEVCTAEEVAVGDKRVDLGRPIGSIASLTLGGGDKGVVMKIPKEWYEADRLEKSKRVDSTEQTMKEDARKAGNYGSIEITRD